MSYKHAQIVQISVDSFYDDFVVPYYDNDTIVAVKACDTGDTKLFIEGKEVIALSNPIFKYSEYLSEEIKEYERDKKPTLPPIHSTERVIPEEYTPLTEPFSLAPDPYFSYCSEEYKKKYGDDE